MPQRPRKFTPAARKRFLAHLVETGQLGRSATAAGVHYTTVYRRLRPDHRLYDPSLADDVEEARVIYAEKLLAEAHRRAVDGWVERGLYVNGRHVGDVRRYSDRLLEHLLRRYDPEYREDVRVIVQERVERVGFPEITEQIYQRLTSPERVQLRVALSQWRALSELGGARAKASEPVPVEELNAEELELHAALLSEKSRAALRARLLAEGRRVPAWVAHEGPLDP